jgi:hypothetical protein
VFHWIAPVLLPALVVFGRGLLGAPTGWMALLAVLVSPIVIIAMYFAPIIVIFDRDAKAVRSTRLFYDIASWVTWAALIVLMFTLVDGGDAPPFGSVVSTWGWMSSETSSGVFASAIVVAFLGWLGALAAAVAGVVQSRSHSVPRETSLPA